MSTLSVGYLEPSHRYDGIMIIHAPLTEEKKLVMSLNQEESRVLFNGIFKCLLDRDREWLKQYLENNIGV